MRRPIIRTKLNIINEVSDQDLKIAAAREVDEQDRTNKYHRWEVSTENLKGETNYDGNIRSFKTIDEALLEFDSIIGNYKDDEDCKSIFLDGWLLDPSEIEVPEPIADVFIYEFSKSIEVG